MDIGDRPACLSFDADAVDPAFADLTCHLAAHLLHETLALLALPRPG